MPTEIEVLKRYQRGKASAPFRSRFFLDLVNHEWFLLLFSWLFFLEHIVLFQVFLFSKFFWSIFFFSSAWKWPPVERRGFKPLCAKISFPRSLAPPPKVPTKKIPNTTQLLVNDGKHYFRVGSLSSNFKSLENGPAVPTQKTTPFLCFFGGPRGPRGALLLRWFHVLLQSCLCTSALQGFLHLGEASNSWNSFPFFSLTVGGVCQVGFYEAARGHPGLFPPKTYQKWFSGRKLRGVPCWAGERTRCWETLEICRDCMDGSWDGYGYARMRLYWDGIVYFALPQLAR